MANESIDFIAMEAAHKIIAMPAEDIIGMEKPSVNPIPSTKHWFEGVSLYGEEILPVINLSKLVSSEIKSGRIEYVVIGRANKPKAYLAVNRIIRRDSIKDDQLYPCQRNIGFIEKFIVGTAKKQGAEWSILDINKLLSSEIIKGIDIND